MPGPGQLSPLPSAPNLNRAGHLPTTRPRGLNGRLRPYPSFLSSITWSRRAGVPPPQVFLKVLHPESHPKLQPREGHLKSGLGEGVERQAEVVGSLNSPALPLSAPTPNAAAPVILWVRMLFLLVIFLAQRDPGPKPHSWWGLSATQYRTSFLTQPLGSPAPHTRLVSQQPLPATNTLRQVCVSPRALAHPGPRLRSKEHPTGRGGSNCASAGGREEAGPKGRSPERD